MFSNCARKQASNAGVIIRELKISLFLPLLFMQQSEQRASGDVLGHDGKLAGVIQTGAYKLDDAGVIEATQDGDFSAEHVYV